jgi:hypothetical protein
MMPLSWLSLLSLLLSGPVCAGLVPLDNDGMAEVRGQGGADLSVLMRLNQDTNAAFNCSPLIYCRLGVAFNNRNHDGTVTGSSTGKKIWLVFKGIQGTFNLQKLQLDGTDLTYVGKDGGNVAKAAIKLTFDPAQPLLIRNAGFGSLALETDSVANEGAGNTPGYLVDTTYPSASGAFDSGREAGFTGLNMNGNLVMGGTLKVFGCDSNHPRC